MSLTEIIDTSMEETNDTVDELLISTVSEETISDIQPVMAKTAKQPAKRKATSAPKVARPTKADGKPIVTKRKPAVVEVYQDGEQDAIEVTEVEPPKPRARAKKAAKSKAVEGEMSDLDETEAPKPKSRAKATKLKTAKEPAKTAKSKAVRKTVEQDDFDAEDPIPSPVNVRSNFLQSKTSKAVPKPVTAKVTKPAVKRVAKTVKRPVEEVFSDQEESEAEGLEEQPPRKRQRTASITQQDPAYRRRAGSASDTERGDPMLRRKLGDVTRKYENIEVKYRSLKDVAVIEANGNVEKLRKQCDAITEKSDKLIAALRKELAQQAAIVQDSRKQSKESQMHEKDTQRQEREIKKHEKEAQRYEKEAQKQEKEATRLRTANSELSSTLTAAQNEIKALQARLAAARATPAPEPAKQQQQTIAKPVPVRNQNQTHSDRETQLKLALYADLTDLLIQNVKQTEEGDEYDCIQTGRNGSLHFKLLFDAENIAKARSSPNSTELEFLYRPQIHQDRDKELISILPDYLTEELTFERNVASKFYARVVNKLDEKIVIEDEEEGEE